MRDRRAEGTFTGRALAVDMDPLMIARAVREFGNACLVERDPGGNAHLLTDVLAQIAQRHRVRHGSPRLALLADLTKCLPLALAAPPVSLCGAFIALQDTYAIPIERSDI